MTARITNRKIWRIAYPIILGGVAQNIVLATDTAFLGRLGEVALGAAALGGLFYYIAVFVANGIGVGAQIIMSRRFGERKYSMIGDLMAQTGLIIAVVAGFLFACLFYLSPLFFSLSVESEAVMAATTGFLSYRAFGVFFATFNVLMRAFFISIHQTKVITITTVIMGVVNIILDYGLIFGRLGLAAMGVEGAALASLTAEATASLFFLFYIRIAVPAKRYNLHVSFKPQWERIGRVMKVATPVMLQNFLSMAGWFVFFLFVAHLGEMELAVSNIIRSIYMIILIPVFGFASAAATLVSFLIGEGRQDDVLFLMKRIVMMVIMATVAMIVPVTLFRDYLLHIYTDNTELIRLSYGPIAMVTGSALFLGTGFTLFQGVSGTGNTMISLLIEGFVLLLYIIAVYFFVYVLEWNLTLVWTAEYIYAFLLGLFSLLYLISGKWKGKTV